MINLAVAGCQGRMGQRIVVLSITDDDFMLSALIERPDHPTIGSTLNAVPISSSLEVLEGCDVLIDFTTPQATMEHLRFCREHKVKMVIGTTGLAADQQETIKAAGADIAIVCSSNMSVGVNVLFKSVALIAKATPDTYRVRMSEAHHAQKKDAPSGTAKTLAELIQAGSHKRVSNIESIREGEIIGDHEVVFDSPEDVITIKHHAKSRDIFVRGALHAAKFVMKQPRGFYTMADVLGLE